MADWRDMNSIFMDPPKLLCSLLAEHQVNQNDSGQLSSGSNEKQSLFPRLKDEAGYFVLGDESKAEEMFFFNIIIGQTSSDIRCFEKRSLECIVMYRKMRTKN